MKVISSGCEINVIKFINYTKATEKAFVKLYSLYLSHASDRPQNIISRLRDYSPRFTNNWTTKQRGVTGQKYRLEPIPK